MMRFTLAFCLMVFPVAAGAQDQVETVTEDVKKKLTEPEKEEDKPAEGWTPTLKLAATGSFTQTSRVVGAVDGTTIQLGLILDGTLTYRTGRHEWANVLKIQETQTRTPQLDSFIKSADVFDLVSLYTYRLKDIGWVGPYGRLRVNTQLLRGFEVRADDVVIIRNLRDSTSVQRNKLSGDKIALTSPFEPLILKESAGFFANPFEDKEFTLKTRAGLGFEQIIVGDGFALADDGATPEIEFVQLQSSEQFGAEVEATAEGVLAENITWNLGAALFYPATTTLDTNLEGVDRMTLDFSAKLSVRLSKWASLDYVLTAKRVPFVLDAFQIQNGVILTAGFDVI